LRANGTAVYMTQDVGVAHRRYEKFNPKKVIYVVADEQNRHFQILFKLMENLLPESKGCWYHLGYGLVLLPTGRMKSREGNVIDADDLIRNIHDLAIDITREKWLKKIEKEKLPPVSEEVIKERAEKVALAAIKFYILSMGPQTTITFDATESLKFKGKAGPYMLYQYARAKSILRKAQFNSDKLSFTDLHCLSKLSTDEEHAVLLSLFHVPTEIAFAAAHLDPSKLCDLAFNISQVFNYFYKQKDKHQILNCVDVELKKARLLLVLAVCNVIKLTLGMLGIDVLEVM